MKTKKKNLLYCITDQGAMIKVAKSSFETGNKTKNVGRALC